MLPDDTPEEQISPRPEDNPPSVPATVPPNNTRLATSVLPEVHFNDVAILKAYGHSPDAIIRALQRFGQPVPTRNTIQQWQSRGRLPRRWLATIAYIAIMDGLPVKSLFRKGPYDYSWS